MRARIGDLAIARFDGDDDEPGKYHEELCIVIGSDRSFKQRELKFIYWKRVDKHGTVLTKSDLPRDCLRVVTPKRNKRLVTNIGDLTIKDVVNVVRR